MQLTWLDVLAANMGAALWLWGLMAARHWWKTEQSKFIPGFILVALVAFGLVIFTARAGHWFDQIEPSVIVPSVAKQ